MQRNPEASPLDSLLRPEGLLAALLLGEGLALVLALAPGAIGDRLVYFGLASLNIQWVALMTMAGLIVLRRPIGRMSDAGITATILALVTVAACMTGLAAWYILPAGEDQGLFLYLAKLTGIAWTLGLLGSAMLLSAWRWRQLSVQIQASRFEALQARVRPHFLFNTLNTAAALVHAQPRQAEQLLLDLSDLFRAALSGPPAIPLADELALARRYLEIEALRFGPRVVLDWRVPADLPDVPVPTLSIQPLVENAIRHGVEATKEPCRISVTVEDEADEIRLIIVNDLAGSPRPASRTGHHVGLRSSRERIASLTAGRGGVDIAIVGNRHVVTVRLPKMAPQPPAIR